MALENVAGASPFESLLLPGARPSKLASSAGCGALALLCQQDARERVRRSSSSLDNNARAVGGQCCDPQPAPAHSGFVQEASLTAAAAAPPASVGFRVLGPARDTSSLTLKLRAPLQKEKANCLSSQPQISHPLQQCTESLERSNCNASCSAASLPEAPASDTAMG